MWSTVLICLFICILVFFSLARFHESLKASKNMKTPSNDVTTSKKRQIKFVIRPGISYYEKYTLLKEQYQVPKNENGPIGLYQFSEPANSSLYTYSMLLLVSLPKLPTGWSLRILTGWYWLYCLLVVTSYRASLTAILARPTPKWVCFFEWSKSRFSKK